MKVLTYLTHSSGYFPCLQKQCEKLNLDLVVLGYGEKWIGFYQRFLAIYEYLKILNDDELVVHIDGFDTIPMQYEFQILEKYKSFNKPVVWSVENDNTILTRVIWLNTLIKKNYGTVNGTMLNGGSYMGEVKYLKIIYEYIFSKYGYDDKKLDDQKIINEIGKLDWFQDIVAFDLKNIIFFNNGLILTDLYKTVKPSFIGLPGKTNGNSLLIELGYPEYVIPEFANFRGEEIILLGVLIIIFILILIIKNF